MKAILYADWLNIKQMMRQVLIVVIGLMIAMAVMKSLAMLYMLVVMLAIMVPMTLSVYDQTGSWERFVLSMPIGRNDVIGSKFLIGGMFVAVMAVFAALVTAVYVALMPGEELLPNLTALVFVLAVAVVLSGVILCMSYKWGTEKARYLFVAIVWVPVVLGILLNKTNIRIPENWVNQVESLSGMQLLGGAVICLIIGIAINAFFYKVTLRIYRKKEF